MSETLPPDAQGDGSGRASLSEAEMAQLVDRVTERVMALMQRDARLERARGAVTRR